MLNLNPTSLIFGEDGHIRTATIANYTPHDLTVRVTALPSHAILALGAPTGIDTTGPTGTDTSQPRHHIGSSSPPDFGSLKLVPLAQATTLQATTLMSTSVSGSFEIANNAVLEIRGPSGKNVFFDTGNGELE